MKKSEGKVNLTVKKVVLLLVMIIISSVALFPFYSMLMMGTYKTSDLYTSIKLIPGNYAMLNMLRVIRTPILVFYRNSFVVALCSTFLCILVCSMAGYVFAKFEFKFKKLLFVFIMLTMMIPTQLGIIAFVIEMRKLGFADTLFPLIVPFAANAFGVYWIMQFTKTALPVEVIESARIDACSEFGIYLRIALPFMRPACITLFLLAFLWSWNDFMYPLVILSKADLYTIPLGIKQMSGAYANDTAAQILGLTVTTLPILILFSVFNKNMIGGLTSSAVKG